MDRVRALRRLSQWAAFILFAFLFLKTEYRGDDVLPYAVNVFLRMDPLVAAAATAAGRAIISLVWPAAVVAVLTALLGRAFCGWVCPMGAVLDAAGAVFRREGGPARPAFSSWRRFKFPLLFFLLASAVFSLQWVFLFDPISVLIRSLAVSIFPALNWTADVFFGGLLVLPPGAATRAAESAFRFAKAHFLAFSQPVFRSSAFVGILFLGIVAAEFLGRRFWCRNLCPLGAFLSLLGRYAPVRRRVDEGACTRCGLCERNCRTGAIAPDMVSTDGGECVECMDCRAVCPEGAIRFTGGAGRRAHPFDPGRRAVLSSAALGALTVPLFQVGAHQRAPNPLLIRPPGALPEKEFLARCTRCGECMRVCIANGLQPALFEAGIEGLWSPVLVPRIGYCEYNCTLCGQVCPTGAITRLALAQKRRVRIGLADIDRSLCLPWKGEAECIVCEEHCPTPEKAIVMRQEPVAGPAGGGRLFKRPYVVERLCIGCGICETKCPLGGRPAVVVTARGESRGESAGGRGGDKG